MYSIARWQPLIANVVLAMHKKLSFVYLGSASLLAVKDSFYIAHTVAALATNIYRNQVANLAQRQSVDLSTSSSSATFLALG